MRLSVAALLLCLAVACATPGKPKPLPRIVHIGNPGRAERPAEVRTSLILPWLPHYEEYVAA